MRDDRPAHGRGGLRGRRGGRAPAPGRSSSTSSATCSSRAYFLALLCEEHGAGDLADVAGGITDKLIRRHPHVFGERRGGDRRRRAPQLGADQARPTRAVAASSTTCRASCRRSFYARKVQRRASAVGFDWHAWDGAWGDLAGRAAASFARRSTRPRRRAPSTSRTPRSCTRRATSCSPASTSPGWPTSIRSWRCAPPPAASATASSGRRAGRRGGGGLGRARPDAQDAWYRRAKAHQLTGVI